MNTGIIERLKASKSYQEALTIVTEGKHYKASPKTRRRWARLILEMKKRDK